MRSTFMFHGVGEAQHVLEPGEGDYWIEWELFDAIVDRFKDTSADALHWTFDDGNASDLEAARRMRSAGITGSFFVLAGRIGQPGYLTRGEIEELCALDMEVGLHGRDHVDWRKTSDSQLRSEVQEASDEIGEICGRPIRSVAIPYGLYDRRVWSFLERSSFDRIYTSDRGRSPVDARFVRRDPIMKWHRIGQIDGIVRDNTSVWERTRRQLGSAYKRLR